MQAFLRTVARGVRSLGQLVRRVGSLLASALRDAVQSRSRLVAENVALRTQVTAPKRQIRRAAPDAVDRVLLVGVSRLVPDALKAH